MTEIKGKLEALNWSLGSGSCSISLEGQVRDFHGHQRLVQNALEAMNISIGDTVVLQVDDIGDMTSIRRAPVCPKCGSIEIEEEKVNACLYWSCLCVICGHSWLEE